MESLCKCANRIRELYIYNGVYGWVPGGNNKKGGKRGTEGDEGQTGCAADLLVPISL